MKDKRKRQLKRRLKRRQQRDPLVGYFAHDEVNVLCDGDACIIAGSFPKMTAIIEHHGQDPARYAIRKTTAGEVLDGLQLGGAYAFDEEAYRRMRQTAQDAGLPLPDEDFSGSGSDPEQAGIQLVRIQVPAADLSMFADDEGMHFVLPANAPGQYSDQDSGQQFDQATLDEWSRRTQENLRKTPLWDEMVREFGPQRADELLKEFRAEIR